MLDFASYIDAGVTAFVGAAVTAAVTWAGSHVKSADARAAINFAVTRGAGVMLDAMHSADPELNAAIGKAAANSKGVDYVLNAVGKQVASLGLTPEHVGNMIAAQAAVILHTGALPVSQSVKAPVATAQNKVS